MNGKVGANIKATVDEVNIDSYKHEKSRRQAELSITKVPNCLTAREIGQRIRKARFEAGLTMERLASKIILRQKGEPMAGSSLGNIEKGMTEAMFYVIQQIAAATGKDVSYFNE